MIKFLVKSCTKSSIKAACATLTQNLAVVATISILTIGNAEAVVVGGGITGGGAFSQGGVFIELTAPFIESDPDNSVGNNNFQTPNLYAFNENQNIVLPNILSVNVGVDVAIGQIVASHYVFFDPDGSTSISGFVDFDAPIIGIATSRVNLDASDVLQNNLVTYLSPELRGLEGGDSVSIIDAIGLFPGNNQRLSLTWRASSPGDYVRVFTQFSPTASVVPLPAALPLFGTGLAFIGFISWRRKLRNAV